jgi:hypothetical protein
MLSPTAATKNNNALVPSGEEEANEAFIAR